MSRATPGGLRIGLDIGATKILGVVIDDAGTVRAQVRDVTEPGGAGVVRSAARVVESLQRQVEEPLTGAVGIGIPGLVDAARGALKHAVNLGIDGEWFPLAELLSARLGQPVAVENDLNAATVGAHVLSGEDDLVYLSLGTGLAAGLVLGGRLRRGDHGAAGEIGHIPVDPTGPVCQCGQRGCLETIASGSALAHAWPSTTTPPAQALFAAAEAGDRRAVEIRDRFAAGVADAVRIAALAVDPRAVILGGGVANLGEPLREAVAGALRVQAAASPFLASLALAERVRLVPRDVPVAALGAALVGRDEEAGR